MSNQKSIEGIRSMPRPATNNKVSKATIAGLVFLWVLALTVIASIGFSSYMVYFGTQDSTAKMLILPQVIAAGLALIALPIVVVHKLNNR